jgi:hypothetical protein
MQSTPGGARNLIIPGQDRRIGITPTMLYQEIAKRGFDILSRIACKNSFK